MSRLEMPLEQFVVAVTKENERLRAQNAGLVDLVVRAQRIIDPCCPEASHQWQKDARAALASIETPDSQHSGEHR